ncbi:hypothetical protein HK100_006426 [Physocladia obscura]|uniref:Aminotransferase class V domain-containing protein n=1 Tax=Physocladia obscura TaxID=109957 RepID=A0AAD5SQG2_9FUNG|nr:hypothetical protein HK100_006426 [Physocladia obscura]
MALHNERGGMCLHVCTGLHGRNLSPEKIESSKLSKRMELESSNLRAQFPLRKGLVALNHGGWGLSPRVVLAAKAAIQAETDACPDDLYLVRANFHDKLNRALEPVASFLGLNSIDDLVFTANTSTSVTAVLRSLKQILKAQGRFPILPNFKSQKILMLSTAFHGDVHAIRYTCINDGFEVLEVPVVYPLSEDALFAIVEEAIAKEQDEGNEIVLAIYDAITSTPGVILPFRRLTGLFKSNNILAFVDAAQAIGQIPVDDIPAYQPDFFSTNLHKWMYVPRSCAVLYVAKQHQAEIKHPVVVDVQENHWKSTPGSSEISNFLTTPAAFEFISSLGGISRIMKHNHELAVKGGQILATALGTSVLKNPSETDETGGDAYYGAMVNIELPPAPAGLLFRELHAQFLEQFNATVLVYSHGGKWWIRCSAQIYVDITDFERMAHILRTIFKLD